MGSNPTSSTIFFNFLKTLFFLNSPVFTFSHYSPPTEFNAIPEGTASIAQVHKATLDGELVAIKIQHKDISSNAAADIKLLTKLSDVSKVIFGKRFNFQWLVDEVRELLDTELDFRNEASNATEARQNHAHFPWLVIPKIHQEYTTRRIQSVKYIKNKFSGRFFERFSAIFWRFSAIFSEFSAFFQLVSGF